VTTFGLVHGAWHGAWCWDLLVPELERRGHAAVAPDLPIDDALAGHAEYARAVVDALAGRDDVVLVGHSMGTLVIPLVAAARPVRGMVFLCGVPLVPGVTVGLDFSNMVSDEVAHAARFRATSRGETCTTTRLLAVSSSTTAMTHLRRGRSRACAPRDRAR
jgi:pimeloyl-ACP methyl ester carboxylesterase